MKIRIRTKIKELKKKNFILVTIIFFVYTIVIKILLQYNKQLNSRERIFIKKNVIKINYLINIEIFILNFVNIAFVIKNKLLKIFLSKLCKLRLVDNKFASNVIYITLIKLIIENYIKNL